MSPTLNSNQYLQKSEIKVIRKLTIMTFIILHFSIYGPIVNKWPLRMTNASLSYQRWISKMFAMERIDGVENDYCCSRFAHSFAKSFCCFSEEGKRLFMQNSRNKRKTLFALLNMHFMIIKELAFHCSFGEEITLYGPTTHLSLFLNISKLECK